MPGTVRKVDSNMTGGLEDVRPHQYGRGSKEERGALSLSF